MIILEYIAHIIRIIYGEICEVSLQVIVERIFCDKKKEINCIYIETQYTRLHMDVNKLYCFVQNKLQNNLF